MSESAREVLTGCLPLPRRKQRTGSLVRTIPGEIRTVNRVGQVVGIMLIEAGRRCEIPQTECSHVRVKTGLFAGTRLCARVVVNVGVANQMYRLT